MNQARDVMKDENVTDPTLFVRLNAGGTNLQGEDLIYSIFKAYYPDGQKLVEGVSSAVYNLIPPSRIIVLAARLVLSELSDGKYQKNLTSRLFQAKIQDGDFRKGMDAMVQGRMAGLMKQVIEILRMEDGEGRFVPDIVVKMFVKDSTEGIMLLLNFLNNECDYNSYPPLDYGNNCDLSLPANFSLLPQFPASTRFNTYPVSGGDIRLGKGPWTTPEACIGSITSIPLDLSKPFKITITAKGWGDEPGKITVCVDGIPQQSINTIRKLETPRIHAIIKPIK